MYSKIINKTTTKTKGYSFLKTETKSNDPRVVTYLSDRVPFVSIMYV